MRSVMLSIRPEWCKHIVAGEKTVELRRTRPKLDAPFKCYIYCTKEKQYFYHGGVGEPLDSLYRFPNDASYDAGKIKYGYSGELMCCHADYDSSNFLNGKVIAEFVCKEIIHICNPHETQLEEMSCVGMEQIASYKADRNLIYGWKISDLVIYNAPKELGLFGLKKAPRSWCYVNPGNGA